MGKFCWQCGTPVTPGNKFCDECGADLAAAPPVPTPTPPPPVSQAPVPPVPQPTPNRPSVPKPYIIIAVVAVIAIIAAALLLSGIFAVQPGHTGTQKGTTSGIIPKYVVGDIVKEADGTLNMVLGIHKGSGLYAYTIVHQRSDGTYEAFDEIWALWMDESFDKFETEYSKVDHTDPKNVVIMPMFSSSTNLPKYAVGDIVMSTSGQTSGFLSVILDVDRPNSLYTENLVHKENDGTYSTWYDEWRRPSYTSFETFESIFTKKVGNVDPKNVVKKYASTELPITQ
jgi:hypothetical protein